MALKIRLRQQGRTNGQVYRLVVTDTRSPRDGKYIEMLGWYNPFQAEAEKNLHLDAARIQHWLDMGAQLTEKAQCLVKQGAPQVAGAHMTKEMERQQRRRVKRRRGAKAKGASTTA